MFKKSLTMITLLCAMVPLVAHAASWSLATRVSTVGGTLQVGNYTAQSSTNGTVFKTYTTSASAGVPVALNALPGYKISAVSVNGFAKTVPADTASLTYAMGNGTDGAGRSSQAVVVSFVKKAAASLTQVTVSPTTGGSVVPAPGTYAVVPASTATVTFTPLPGYKLTAVSPACTYKDANTGAVISSLGAGYAGAVRASFVVPTSNITVTGTFTADAAVSAGANQTVSTGSLVTLSGSVTPSTGAQYSWVQTSGPTVTLTGADTATPTFTPAVAAAYVFKLTAGNNAGNGMATTTVFATSVNATFDPTACYNCHNGSGVGAGVQETYAASAHSANGVTCVTCHLGADSGAHPGTVVGCSTATCHATLNLTWGAPNTNCASCHNGPGAHSTMNCATCHAGHAAHTTSDDCIGCHGAALSHPGNVVYDNNGVRAITGEFNKNSHHVFGKTLSNADCAVCHAEGKVSNGNIVIDTNFHMKDNKIYLRNGNTALAGNQNTAMTVSGVSVYAWNPATPNHTLMDQFCMSCHNSGGAPQAVGIVTGNSNINPFNDAISNGYDTLRRPAVVAVFEQFDTNNVAHHAVRGQKYTTRHKPAGPSVFTQYSGAASFPAPTGAAYNNYSTVAEGKLAIATAGVGPLYPGSRQTLYEAGLFVSTYTPLGASANVADDSTLHCGDCHTVGQFKAGSTTNAEGVAITAAQVIGAHGSVNEYMLRTSIGDDVLHHQSTGAVGDENGTYVCFLCHVQSEEETGGYNAMGFHGGIEGSNTSYCNGRAAESVGLTGVGGAFSTTYDSNGVKTNQTRVPNLNGTSSNGNIFGYSCAHCHNAGNNNTFGGIHGGNVAYKSYSTNGTLASRNNNGFAIVQKKPYRFMGGMSLRYQGGGDAGKWEAKTLTKANREGCYNQSTVTNTNSNRKLWGAQAQTDINGVTDDTAVNPTLTNGTSNGTWGTCSHHNGGTTSGGGTASTRVGVQRPLSY